MKGLEYVQRVSQARDLARHYWFDVLVAVLAILAMVEVVLGRGSPGAPRTTLWFSVPAIAILVLAVFARRRFPFAGPGSTVLTRCCETSDVPDSRCGCTSTVIPPTCPAGSTSRPIG